MFNFTTIRVMAKLKPYIRVLTVYNSNNFRRENKNWRRILISAGAALGTTLMIVILIVYSVSCVCYFIEHKDNLETMVVAFPIIFGTFQFAVTFITMVVMNKTIEDTANRLQTVIEASEYCVLGWLLFEE